MTIKSSEEEVLTQCVAWLEDGHTVEMVTVARTWGSSPRPVGSLAAVRDDGLLVGSVSGGCVEKQLSESFRQRPTPVAFTHKIDDIDARKFGLACGGNLELVFETLKESQPIQEILNRLAQRERVKRTIHLGSEKSTVETATRSDEFEFDGQILTRVFGPSWRLLLIGAGQLSRYTAQFALALDYEVFVCDPRPEFRSAWDVSGTTLIADSPDDAVISYASDSQSAVLALTHDPNLDDTALMEALPANSFYVGALGSVKNHAGRKKRLKAIGLTEQEIDRLHGPIGLPIGSRTSPEIAISIMAELIKNRSDRLVE